MNSFFFQYTEEKMESSNLVVVFKTDNPHQVRPFAIIVISPAISNEEFSKRFNGDVPFTILANCSDRNTAEEEMWRMIRESQKEYTRLLKSLPDLSQVKDRSFLVHLDEEVTYLPGAYSVDMEQYQKLISEFKNIRLADEGETIRKLIMAKDPERIRKLHLGYGLAFSTSEPIKSEDLEAVQKSVEKTFSTMKQVIQHCSRIANGEPLTNRKDVVAQISKLIPIERVEETVDDLIEQLKVGEGLRLPSVLIKEDLSGDYDMLAIDYL